MDSLISICYIFKSQNFTFGENEIFKLCKIFLFFIFVNLQKSISRKIWVTKKSVLFHIVDRAFFLFDSKSFCFRIQVLSKIQNDFRKQKKKNLKMRKNPKKAKKKKIKKKYFLIFPFGWKLYQGTDVEMTILVNLL